VPHGPFQISLCRRLKSLKYQRRWGARPSPLPLLASAFTTWPQLCPFQATITKVIRPRAEIYDSHLKSSTRLAPMDSTSFPSISVLQCVDQYGSKIEPTDVIMWYLIDGEMKRPAKFDKCEYCRREFTHMREIYSRYDMIPNIYLLYSAYEPQLTMNVTV
jgi:hypothetical protein